MTSALCRQPMQSVDACLNKLVQDALRGGFYSGCRLDWSSDDARRAVPASAGPQLDLAPAGPLQSSVSVLESPRRRGRATLGVLIREGKTWLCASLSEVDRWTVQPIRSRCVFTGHHHPEWSASLKLAAYRGVCGAVACHIPSLFVLVRQRPTTSLQCCRMHVVFLT